MRIDQKFVENVINEPNSEKNLTRRLWDIPSPPRFEPI